MLATQSRTLWHRGSFVSWWFTEPPLKYGIPYTLVFFFAVFISMDLRFWPWPTRGLCLDTYGTVLGFASVFGVLFTALDSGKRTAPGLKQWESSKSWQMPLIGPLY